MRERHIAGRTVTLIALAPNTKANYDHTQPGASFQASNNLGNNDTRSPLQASCTGG